MRHFGLAILDLGLRRTILGRKVGAQRPITGPGGQARTAGPAFATSALRGRVFTSLRLYQRLAMGRMGAHTPPVSTKRSHL